MIDNVGITMENKPAISWEGDTYQLSLVMTLYWGWDDHGDHGNHGGIVEYPMILSYSYGDKYGG